MLPVVLVAIHLFGAGDLAAAQSSPATSSAPTATGENTLRHVIPRQNSIRSDLHYDQNYCFVAQPSPPRRRSSIPPAANIIGKNLAPHPRLLLPPVRVAQIRKMRATDPQFADWYARFNGGISALLDSDETLEETYDARQHLLGPVGFRAESELSSLAVLYLLSTDEALRAKIFARAKTQALAIASFSTWNPRHFLDVAYLAQAVAIALDAFYDRWTAAERQRLAQALLEKAILPALARIYRPRSGIFNWTSNWNPASNVGAAYAALALAENDPNKTIPVALPPGESLDELVREVLVASLESIRAGNHLFDDDGSFRESPNYWNAATRNIAKFYDAFYTSLGTDFDVPSADGDGLKNSAHFRLQTTNNRLGTFNFGDDGDERSTIGAPGQLFWLARRFNRPEYAQMRRWIYSRDSRKRVSYLDIVYGATPAAPFNLPTAAVFPTSEIATFRSSWDASDGLFVGIKGVGTGGNSEHHHLDGGTFVVDDQGERFLIDLGRGNYAWPGYFTPAPKTPGGNYRWQYYQTNSRGQNVVVIDDQDQRPAAPSCIIRAPITRYEAAPEKLAILDLTPAYYPQVKNFRRGIRFAGDTIVLLQDEIDAPTAINVVWQAHTKAEVIIDTDKHHATLRTGSKLLHLRLIGDSDGYFESAPVSSTSAEVYAGKLTATDVNKILVRFAENKHQRQFAVVISREGDVNIPEHLIPLSEW